MSKADIRAITTFVALFVYMIYWLWTSKKRKEQKQQLLKKASVTEFECELFPGIDKVASKLAVAYNAGVKSNVLLFDDYIAFATGVTGDWQPEILISDINSAKMEKQLWKELLFIDHNAKFVEEGKTKKYENQFYLSGDKDELLYIKDFIEERMLIEKLQKQYPC